MSKFNLFDSVQLNSAVTSVVKTCIQSGLTFEELQEHAVELPFEARPISSESSELRDQIAEYFATRNYMIWPSLSHNIKEYEGRSIPECSEWIIQLLKDLEFIE